MAPVPPPEQILSSSGWWAYLIIAIVLLAEAVPLVGAMIPAQLFMLGAGFLAGAQPDPHHRLYLRYIILVAFASLYVADIVSFALGRKYGMRMLDHLPRAMARRAQALSKDLATHAGKTLVLGKFLGPARALTPPLAGAGRVSWPRFLAWEAIGSLLWVTVLTVLGKFFGERYKLIERRLGFFAVLLLLFALVAYIGVMRYRTQRVDDRLAGEPGRPPP